MREKKYASSDKEGRRREKLDLVRSAGGENWSQCSGGFDKGRPVKGPEREVRLV